MKAPVSEIVGRSKTRTGEEVALYRALRPLVCAGCGQQIACGEMFTRRKLGGVAILPRCGECTPFILDSGGRGELLKSLLEPPCEPKTPSEVAAADKLEKTLREVERRLGPALARSRRAPSHK